MRRIRFAFQPTSSLTAAVACAWALTATHPRTAAASDCAPQKPATFTVSLPKLGAVPASENPEGWDLPAVWEGHPGATSDSITVPNGRPIYALIISGYAINAHFDELLVYNFARHLMSKGAYVHWAWWNNLLNPYLGGPLHYSQSHPGIITDLGSFGTPAAAGNKAVPADDYQFIADAKLFVSAIRANNPEAIIVIVGHSMGGNSCARLADQVSANVVIDLVASIDPVGNRNYPWAGPLYSDEKFYNWTRWRATRANFLGFKREHFLPLQGGCTAVEPWFDNYGEALIQTDVVCSVHVHDAGPITYGSNIINIWHRWQTEALFPFDFEAGWQFGANPPVGGTSSQAIVAMQSDGNENGGWSGVGGDCCPIGQGVAWGGDGHGEIIGTRGPAVATKPLGTRVRTSPKCGVCSDHSWPWRELDSDDNWIDSPDNIEDRVDLMQDLEAVPFCADPPLCTNNPPPTPGNDTWTHKPYNAALCKVSTGLINRFNTMNKAPVPDAGPDQFIKCNNCSSAPVTLDGSGTTDGSPVLDFTWTWSGGSATGEIVNVVLPAGPTCVELEVNDPTGHTSLDYVKITVYDADAPVMPYTSSATLWKKDVESHEAYAFDSFYPGLPNALGCLLQAPVDPAVIELDGGTLTVSAEAAGDTYCAITDSGTTPAVSDALINHSNSVVKLEFDPPVTAFYTYFGSLAVGKTASMKLYSGDGATLVDTITSMPSTNISLASGLGFTSTTPIDRIELTATEAGGVLVGAFVGLKTGEPSLGTVNLPGYAGPDGSNVELDFGVVFVDPCPADIDDSGSVNVDDLLLVISAWGPAPPPGSSPADIDGNGTVNVDDLLAVISAWGACG